MRRAELAGKIAVVTGASSGIGRGIALRFAREGARVVLAARRAEALEAVAREAGGETLVVPTDVAKKDDVERLFDRTLERFGGVDVLVNNAGWPSAAAHILEMDERHWDTVVDTNLKSVYLCSHRAANVMVELGTRGSIVNISSMAATRAHRHMAAYDATKAGMEGLTRALALDLAPFGIRVNVVGPGAIHVDASDPRGEGEEARLRATSVPLGRVGFPEDIAGAVAFLCSDDAGYVTGQCLYVDGGMLAQLRSPQVDNPLPDRLMARLRRARPADRA